MRRSLCCAPKLGDGVSRERGSNAGAGANSTKPGFMAVRNVDTKAEAFNLDEPSNRKIVNQAGYTPLPPAPCQSGLYEIIRRSVASTTFPAAGANQNAR